MILATAIASIGIFIVAFGLLGIAKMGTGVLVVAKNALAAIHDKNLDDEASEKVVRRASIQLIGAFFSILFRSTLALLAAFVPIWVSGLTGLAASKDVLDYLSRWDVIMAASLVLVSGYFVWMRIRPSE
jgi:hypothetical protein